MSERNQVFISYSHKDADWLERLRKMLRPLLRQNAISVWDDTLIKPGDLWQAEIEQALSKASVALLLVSADFLDSDFIANYELPPLLQAAKDDGLTILWVYIGFCLYEETPVQEYQAAHNIISPLEALSVSDQNKELMMICKKIKASFSTASIAYGVEKTNPMKLPYLCDRSDQRAQLQEVVTLHQLQKAHRPLLLIVHGHEYECHTEFLEVIKNHELKVSLQLEKKQLSIEERALEWPSSHNEFSVRLEKNISLTLCGISGKTPQEIMAAIEAYKAPLMIKVVLLDEDVDSQFNEKLHAFIKFWDDWPDVPNHQPLIVSVLAKYQGNFDALRPIIDTLDLDAFKQISGVVLPKLSSIRRQHVEAWVNHCCCHAKIENRHIRELFANTTDGIPMEILAEQLQALLHA